MRRVLVLPALACTLVGAIAVANAGAAGQTVVIKTKGDRFAPNPKDPPSKVDINNLHWGPSVITVHSGRS